MKNCINHRGGFFYPRLFLAGALCFSGLLLAFTGFGMPPNGTVAERNNGSSKIAPEVMAETANGQHASAVIFLADQADVSAAYQMRNQDARGWFVYRTLSQHATRTQAGLQSFLTANGIAFQSFWAANMIVATVDRSLAESIAARGDVQRIDSNRPTRWVEDPEVANYGSGPESPSATTAVEWGVQNVNAPAVWAMGFTGTGIVIGNLDTGMRWDHNALKNKYRGWNGVTADHNFNWHDSIHSGGGTCGPNAVAPCDDHGHGTHTTGTTVGDDGAGNQVGVAPGAKWIGCRNMDVGNGTPATYTECFQFMIAPTDLSGNNANPSVRPHVLNNSWGCPASEGCVTRAELETIVNNTQAAGIFVVVSAGNSGPSCSSVSDAPAIYNASFSVGAIDVTNTLASFSSRGPSTFYSPNLLKPNVSAPGVSVRSSTRTSLTSFGSLSGTSMAGPHVAGVVALLWSARPALVRDIATTKTILQNTANPGVTVSGAQTCGGTPSSQIPNNSFGYGRVDVLAAVNAAAPTPTPTPTATPVSAVSISGTVSNCSNPSPGPVANVTLTLTGSASGSTVTDSSGNYQFPSLPSGGTYTVAPSKTALAPGAAGINTVDVVAVQRHFLQFVLLTGCRLTAADVNSDSGISTVDVIAIQRFFLGLTTGLANAGTYRFTPVSRNYSAIVTSQPGQNYDTLVLGDVASPFAERPQQGGD